MNGELNLKDLLCYLYHPFPVFSMCVCFLMILSVGKTNFAMHAFDDGKYRTKEKESLTHDERCKYLVVVVKVKIVVL